WNDATDPLTPPGTFRGHARRRAQNGADQRSAGGPLDDGEADEGCARGLPRRPGRIARSRRPSRLLPRASPLTLRALPLTLTPGIAHPPHPLPTSRRAVELLQRARHRLRATRRRTLAGSTLIRQRPTRRGTREHRLTIRRVIR